MRHLERNPHQGLTNTQLHELDAAYEMPHRHAMTEPQRYRDIATEYARRCASLLVFNDLRGALSAAEIAAAAEAIATNKERETVTATDRTRELRRLARMDPDGMLVSIAGHKKQKRLYPGEPWPDGAFGDDPLHEEH